MSLIGMAAAQPAPSPSGHAAASSLYVSHCAACHGMHMEGRTGPALIDPTIAAQGLQQLATTIKTSMPLNEPGSLTDDEAHLLATYILNRNAAKAPAH